MTSLLFANLTYAHIAIVVLVAILLFGKRLPEMGKTLAKSIRDFKDGMAGIENDLSDGISPPAQSPRLSAPTQRITMPPSETENNGFTPESPMA